MIYLICLIFYIGILIFLNLRKDLNSFEKFGWGSIIFIITFIVSAMINLIIISLIPPDINETGVPVIINPVTNEYHIINSSGKIIEQDNINFIVSSEVEKIKAKYKPVNKAYKNVSKKLSDVYTVTTKQTSEVINNLTFEINF